MMLKESIQFIETYQDSTQEPLQNISEDRIIDKIAEKYKKIVIVNVKLENNELYIENDPILLSNKLDEKLKRIGFIKLRKWLKQNSNYSLLKNLQFDKYIEALSLPEHQNKCIGSKSGLLSFSLFHFNFKKEWIARPNKTILKENRYGRDKIDSFKLKEDIIENTKNTRLAKIINSENGISKIYRKSIKHIIQNLCLFSLDSKNRKYLTEKNEVNNQLREIFDREGYPLQGDTTITQNNENGWIIEDDDNRYMIKDEKDQLNIYQDLSDDLYVYLNLDMDSSDFDIDSPDLIDDLQETFLSYKLPILDPSRNPEIILEGVCPICEENKTIGMPASFNNLNRKLPFVRHLTRNDDINVRICVNCMKKLNDFEKFLKDNDIYFFPLFVDKQNQEKEINYLKGNDDLTFFDIIEHINDISKSKQNDFILLHQSNDILFYDYISNYELELGEQENYLVQNDKYSLKTKRSLRQVFREKEILGLRNSQIFRSDIGKVKNPQKYLIYKYRQKIFDLVYRNKNILTDKDLKDIISQILDDRIRNDIPSQPYYDERKILDLYLNSDLFVRKPGDMIQRNRGKNMLEKIKKEKEAVVNQKSELQIESDAKFGYYLGQLIYHLIERSESKNKMNLLTPMLDCQSKESIKRTVTEKYLDKYYHTLSDYKDFRHKVLSETLDYLQSDLNSNFNKIKVPFYIGFFDENIFYETEKDEKEDLKNE